MMRITRQGEKYDDVQLLEMKYSKRTYEAFKETQVHQASQRLNKEMTESLATVPQESMNDTQGSGFRTEMNKTTGPFSVRSPMYVSQQRDRETGAINNSGTFLPNQKLYGELNTSSRSGFLIEDSVTKQLKSGPKRVYYKNRINTTARSRIMYPDDLDSHEAKQSVSLNKVELKTFNQQKRSKFDGSHPVMDLKQANFRISD